MQNRLRQKGVILGTTGSENGRANHLLAHVCSDQGYDERRSEFEMFKASLMEEVAALEPQERLLLTSEAFQNANPQKVAEILPYPLHVVVYLREQFAYLLSSYSQAVHRQRVSLQVSEFEKQRFNPNYERFLNSWERHIPNCSLSVGIYDRDTLAKGDIRVDFLNAIGLPYMPPEEPQASIRQNLTIGGAILEFKRRLNALPFDHIIAPAMLYLILQKVAFRSPELNRGVNFPPELSERVRGRFQAGNQAVASKWFNTDSALFTHRSIEPVDPELLKAPALESVAEQLDRRRSNLGSDLVRLMLEHGVWVDAT